MPEIRKLPPAVVNKIAAGEVIERPASVVKELMENAVDAGSTRVDVSLEQGGVQLVRVSDNGCGISGDQLLLAIDSHATSKLRDADDLFRVHTLGFRGEALASIAAVSQFCLRSREPAAEAGYELQVNGGNAQEVTPCGAAPGTTLEVSNLFFNTPVRRKFLKTTQTELGHASEAFTRIALANPAVHFTLRHNGRTIQDLPPSERWRDRITAFFGKELAETLLWVSSDIGEVTLSGYVAEPQCNRGNNRLQYLFLNGRHIRDRSLQHALGEAYRGLLMTGRFPIAFLQLEMPPEVVDVNVHPCKLEVRFQDSGQLYSQLLGTIRNKFLTTDLTARVQEPATQPLSSSEYGSAAASMDPQHAEAHRRSVTQWAQGQPAAEAAGELPAASFAATRQTGLELEYARGEPVAAAPAVDLPAPTQGLTQGSTVEGIAGLQLQDRYLVTESGDGIVVIDQHALHERVLYEQIREKTLGGRLESQRLLVPEPVGLTPAEAAAALEARETLAQLGILIEPFGGDTVLVTAYPAMLASLGPVEVLRQVVDLLMNGGQRPDRRDLVDELLHMMSCKAAVKAGDRLSREEVNALLEQRHLCQDAHHCPHGRPTALVFSREELDKRFKRI